MCSKALPCLAPPFLATHHPLPKCLNMSHTNTHTRTHFYLYIPIERSHKRDTLLRLQTAIDEQQMAVTTFLEEKAEIQRSIESVKQEVEHMTRPLPNTAEEDAPASCLTAQGASSPSSLSLSLCITGGRKPAQLFFPFFFMTMANGTKQVAFVFISMSFSLLRTRRHHTQY